MQGGTFHSSEAASWVGRVRTAFDRWTEGALERIEPSACIQYALLLVARERICLK